MACDPFASRDGIVCSERPRQIANLVREQGEPCRITIIVVTGELDAVAEKVISDGLDRFNGMHVGYGDRQPLTVLVRTRGTGSVVGGAVGRSSLGLAFLDLLFLPPDLRGRGVGVKVLQAFEEEARRRQCRSAVVYTISFQAPQFYERNGWTRFGEVPCDPPGTSRVFLSKSL